MARVFTYGTLEIPEVMEAVTRRILSSVAATASGFARFLVKDQIYPGMTPDPDSTTWGRVYFGVDSETLKILDEFEDEVYVRQMIIVQTQNGDSLNAYCYIIPLEHRAILTSQPWSREEFIKYHLHKYVRF